MTLFGAPNSNKSVAAIHSCLKEMSNVQVAAIITKYVKEHPERWHLGTNILGYEALTAVCPLTAC
jgi:hypothetical protein